MYVIVLPASMPMYHIYVPGVHRGQRFGMDLLELELQVIVRHCVM